MDASIAPNNGEPLRRDPPTFASGVPSALPEVGLPRTPDKDAPLDQAGKSSPSPDAPITADQAIGRYKSIFGLNFSSRYEERQKDQGLSPKHFTRIDALTAKLTQIDGLVKAIGNTRTELGQHSLSRTLHVPTRDIDLVRARQTAIRELETDPELRLAIDNFLVRFNQPFRTIAQFIKPPMWRDRKRQAFDATREALDELKAAAEVLPDPKSRYLRILTDAVKALDSSQVWDLFHEKICAVKVKLPEPKRDLFDRAYENDVILAKDAPFVTRMLDGHGWPVPPRMSALMLGMTGGILGPLALIDPKLAPALAMPFLMIVPLMIKMKRDSDNFTFYSPLANKFGLDPVFLRFMDSVGHLDEISALSTLGQRFPDGGCFPEIEDAPAHFFHGEEVHNPTIVLSKESSRGSIANDFMLGDKPWAFTGPNSGGKSTSGITIIQVQDLIHAGARVPGRRVVASLADTMCYQAQAFNSLEDQEGRFGTELKESDQILDLTTARSIRVFDELAQGTTRGESNIHAGNIVRCHDAIGGTTIFITHAFELVEELAAEGSVIAKQIQYRGGVPTHRIIDGISRYSGSDLVAARVKMDPVSLEQRLNARGIKLKQPLKHPTIPPPQE
ncbi:MAG: hypothetical protein J0M12_11350 [Deltaproteobacteria bacterium]|nr:hypothetical protein [Deltaproteobacteria bacterium]